jgi:hypothetical protein
MNVFEDTCLYCPLGTFRNLFEWAARDLGEMTYLKKREKMHLMRCCRLPFVQILIIFGPYYDITSAQETFMHIGHIKQVYMLLV